MKRIRSNEPGPRASRAARVGASRAEAGAGPRETFRAFIRALEKIDGASAERGRGAAHSGEGAR